MKKIKRGWALSKKSWGLLNEHRELIRFPLYGALATIPLAFIFLGPGLYFLDDGSLAGAIPLLVIGVYVLAWSASTSASASRRPPTRSSAASRRPSATGSRSRAAASAQIAGWAAVSTAISVIMGALENQGGIAGTIAARFVGMAWSLVTFLAVPVIAIEGTGPFETLKRSAQPVQIALGRADHRQPRDRRRRSSSSASCPACC